MGCGASPLDASPAGEDGTSGQEKGATTGKAGELSKAASMGDASPTAEETLTETTIFARLVAELGRQPGRCLALTVIRKRLTEMNLPTLRQRAEDTGYLRKWLQKFPGLLELTGPPGAEQLRLTLGRAPQAQPPASGTSGGCGAADAAPSARAPPGHDVVSRIASYLQRDPAGATQCCPCPGPPAERWRWRSTLFPHKPLPTCKCDGRGFCLYSVDDASPRLTLRCTCVRNCIGAELELWAAACNTVAMVLNALTLRYARAAG